MNLKHRSDAAVQMERGNYYFGQQALWIHLRLSDARLFGEAVGFKHHFIAAELPDHISSLESRSVATTPAKRRTPSI